MNKAPQLGGRQPRLPALQTEVVVNSSLSGGSSSSRPPSCKPCLLFFCEQPPAKGNFVKRLFKWFIKVKKHTVSALINISLNLIVIFRPRHNLDMQFSVL